MMICRQIFSSGLFIFFFSFFLSCTHSRSAYYFDGLSDTTLYVQTIIPDPLIQNNDILSIHISSMNQEASALFNAPNDMATATTTISGHQEAGGYLVDAMGNLQIPLLGKMKVAGMTKSTLRDRIMNELKDKQLLLDPVVTIRHLNYEVTIVGEVGKPTVINVPNERITLLKALGMAGDITIFGMKDQVLLIREQSGKRAVHHLRLDQPQFIHSPFYYLQPGDVIYVEPNHHRIASASGKEQVISITLSALSFLAIILTQLFR